MKTIFATIGLFFFLMFMAGGLGIGKFVMYYGADESVRCVSQPATGRSPATKE